MVEPGWYNDERDPTKARWHDGVGWTDHTVEKTEWAGRGKPPAPGPDDWGTPPASAPAQTPGSTPTSNTRGRWFLAAALVVAALAVGYVVLRDDGGGGGAPTSGRSFDSPRDIADALNAAGFECSDYEDIDLSGEDDKMLSLGPELRSKAGRCELEGQELSLDLFEDHAHHRQWNGLAESMGCAFMESFGVTEVNYAEGNLWQVSLEDGLDAELARTIADALDGEYRYLKC